MTPVSEADTKTRILTPPRKLSPTLDSMPLAPVHHHTSQRQPGGSSLPFRLQRCLDRRRLCAPYRSPQQATAGAAGPLRNCDSLWSPAPGRGAGSFRGPALRLTADRSMGGKVFMRLFGRTIAEPSEPIQAMLNEQFGHTVQRFLGAFKRALPGVPAGCCAGASSSW